MELLFLIQNVKKKYFKPIIMGKSKNQENTSSRNPSPTNRTVSVTRRSRSSSPLKQINPKNDTTVPKYLENLLESKFQPNPDKLSTALGSCTTDTNNNRIPRKKLTKRVASSSKYRNGENMILLNHTIPISGVKNVANFRIQTDLYSPGFLNFQKRLNECGMKARAVREEIHGELNCAGFELFFKFFFIYLNEA